MSTNGAAPGEEYPATPHRTIIGVLASIAGGVLIVLFVVAALTGKSSKSTGYRVRSIFDDAAFAVPGESVRVAGATVGSIQSLDVTAQRKAAVTLLITDSRFAPFHADASCAIRPQSLIGEKYVDCNPGSANAPALPRIDSGPGTGSHYLPVTQTHSPVDSDIVQSIYRQPTRERFALIINELGTGLAARGSDLNSVIHRADPALGYTDQVLKILSAQNKQLAQLSSDSDAVLTPLARVRSEIQGFIRTANTTSAASATRAAAITQSVRLFPQFLTQLRPLVVQLGNLADQGTPLMSSLAQSAGALGRQFQNLAPFATAARPALIALGHYSQLAQPHLIGTESLNRLLLHLGQQSLPATTLLDQLTASLDNSGGIEQLMTFLYNGVSAGNGFDSIGHYIRTQPWVGGCNSYDTSAIPICNAHFVAPATSAAVSASASPASATAVKASADRSAADGSSASASASTVSALTPAPPSEQPAPASPLPALLNYLLGSSR